MKKIIFLLLCFLTLNLRAQTQKVLWPEDRFNRIFIGGFISSITYVTTFALTNQHTPKLKHLPAILTTAGVSLVGGCLSYVADKSNPTNRRQNLVGWFGSSVGFTVSLRFTLNR